MTYFLLPFYPIPPRMKLHIWDAFGFSARHMMTDRRDSLGGAYWNAPRRFNARRET